MRSLARVAVAIFDLLVVMVASPLLAVMRTDLRERNADDGFADVPDDPGTDVDDDAQVYGPPTRRDDAEAEFFRQQLASLEEYRYPNPSPWPLWWPLVERDERTPFVWSSGAVDGAQNDPT